LKTWIFPCIQTVTFFKHNSKLFKDALLICEIVGINRLLILGSFAGHFMGNTLLLESFVLMVVGLQSFASFSQ
jgi:hypothetical protein